MVCVNAVKQITPHTQTMHQKNVRKTLNETSKWRDNVGPQQMITGHYCDTEHRLEQGTER